MTRGMGREIRKAFIGTIALILALKSFVERESAQSGWIFIVLNQLFQTLLFVFNNELEPLPICIFLSGIVIAAVLGFWSIQRLKKAGRSISLSQFNGHVYRNPGLAFVFVLACLGMLGFPITPTFLGIDLMLGKIYENQFLLLFLEISNLIVGGLAVYRIYSRLFLGPDRGMDHDFAYQSS